MTEPTWFVWVVFTAWLACVVLLAHRHLGRDARQRRRRTRIVHRRRPTHPPRSHVHRHPAGR